MLLLRGDKGREAAKDSPRPEEVGDPPRNLEGTSLRWSSVVDLSPTRCECLLVVWPLHLFTLFCLIGSFSPSLVLSFVCLGYSEL